MQTKKPRAPTAPLAWDDVRLFLALSRARTLGQAAEAFGVDISTVSRRLVSMEAQLGAKLFDRGRSGLVATEAAEGLVPIAEEIEASMLRFAGASEELDQEVSGLVRIACPPDVAEVFVVPRLAALGARHPAIRLEIAPGEAVVDLSRREADIALRTVRPESGDLVVARLTTTRWVVAASAKRARALGPLRAWAAAPWISWGERLRGAPPARWLARYAPSVEPVVCTDSLMLQLSLVRSGIGVALVPEPSLSHYGLVPLPLHRALREDAAAWPSVDLHLVTHRALRSVPRVRAVWEALSAGA